MQWIEAEVIRQKLWVQNLHSLYVRAQIEPFEAGQFTYLANKNNPKLFRPYSFVNGPQDAVLEFNYTCLGQGGLSDYLASLQAGDSLLIHPKPKGRFTLSNVPSAKHLWCFATGTGVGVFLSICSDSAVWQRFERVIFMHSVHAKDQLTHQDKIQAWQQQFGVQFDYVPVVTQEAFAGLTQRLPILFANGALEKVTGFDFDLNHSHAMLCGNPNMVKDMTACLQARGAKLHDHISLEKYWK